MNDPVLITNWDELEKCESPTHHIIIDEDGYLWVFPKGKNWDDKFEWSEIYYLSSHTFYSKTYEDSTRELQKRGFNVIIDNWDK